MAVFVFMLLHCVDDVMSLITSPGETLAHEVRGAQQQNPPHLGLVEALAMHACCCRVLIELGRVLIELSCVCVRLDGVAAGSARVRSGSAARYLRGAASRPALRHLRKVLPPALSPSPHQPLSNLRTRDRCCKVYQLRRRLCQCCSGAYCRLARSSTSSSEHRQHRQHQHQISCIVTITIMTII